MSRWTFYDGSDTYIFEVNPNEGGTPSLERSIEATSGAFFESKAQPQVISFSGVLLHQAQYDAMDDWTRRNAKVRITDDTGHQQWCYLRVFDPKRAPHRHTPWRNQYTCEAVETTAP